MSRRRRWLALHVGGQKWSVYLVSARSKFLEDGAGGHLYGHTFLDQCRIYIDRDADEQSREDTLLHELLHACLHVSGGSIGAALDDVTEERLVRCLTPVLHRLLKDLGFRFPKGTAL